MSKFPKAFGVYNLTENFMKTIPDNFKGTGDDNSLTNSKIIHIGSAPLERMIGLTAFIESYKISLQKEVKEDSAASSENTYFTDVDGNLSISLTLNIPAHSTNESVNNVAKIEELQRISRQGDWGTEGFSTLSNTNAPIMIVHFANLITNSRKVTSFKINSFEDLLQKGFPCYIENISYNPEPNAGFFEFKHFLYPKNIKLTLDLKYESEKIIDRNESNQNKVAIESFSLYHKFLEVEAIGEEETTTVRMDDGMFPFHSDGIKHYDKPWKKMSVKTMNNLSSQNFGENTKHFLYIGMTATNGYTSYIDDANSNKDFLANGEYMKYVMFENAVVSFSRNLSMAPIVSTADDATPDSSIHNDLKSSKFKSLEYPMQIDVVSSTLAEAYQNCAKIQYLMRIFIKKSYSYSQISATPNSDLAVSNMVQVYMPSFIESGKGGRAASTNLKTIVDQKAINLHFIDLDVTVDMSSGFYEDRGRLFPKKMSLTMMFKTGDPNYILGYNYNDISQNPQWEIATPEVAAPPVYDVSKPFLFPYNRKTVRIGGK